MTDPIFGLTRKATKNHLDYLFSVLKFYPFMDWSFRSYLVMVKERPKGD